MLKLQISSAFIAASLLLTPLAFADDDDRDDDNRGRKHDKKTVSATVGSSSVSAIQSQIEGLKQMLENLKKQQKEVEKQHKAAEKAVEQKHEDEEDKIEDQIKHAKRDLKFARSLSRGMSGDDVRDLQELLAQDPTIFDGTNISGFFGPKTEKALKKFQKKHGIHSIGIFGPASQAKILALFAGRELPPGIAKRLGMSFGSTTVGTGFVTVCHKPAGAAAQSLVIAVPALGGHLGHGDTLGLCGGNGTTTPPIGTTTDSVAPVISALNVTGLTSTGASINWNTNEVATGKVYYGTTTPVNLATAPNIGSSFTTLGHVFALSSLTPSFTYYYVVESKDASGNTATTTTQQFTTAAVADTTAPLISSVGVSGISSTSATIIWTSNEAATGKVFFGTTTPVNFATFSAIGTTSLSTGHAFTLTGLSATTTYYYALESKDAANNVGTTSTQQFTTTN